MARQDQRDQAKTNGAAATIDCRTRAALSGSFLFFHFRAEAAAVELDRHGVAELDLGGVAEEVAVGVAGDGVAAFQDFQRTAFEEL